MGCMAVISFGFILSFVHSKFRLQGKTYNGKKWRRTIHSINKYDMLTRSKDETWMKYILYKA